MAALSADRNTPRLEGDIRQGDAAASVKISAGDLTVDYRPGVYRFANSSGADAIAKADIGAKCFIVDDQTVAKTDGTGTRSPAGIIDGVDANGVWVRLDEALTNAT